MSDVVIRAEGLSKLYQLGEVGTGTLSHDLNRFLARMRGKEDPFAKVGQVNDHASMAGSLHEYVWALRDISFEVKQGEVVGIIGKNGAGKSTLLKILSRVTAPSSGLVKIRGRIASLLEVGTGFHPEMTGRENVYMNGTILGMTKKEIDRKLDDIVDFAGVAKYMDTPTKRYSSGMQVRLAFSVAAFLEPEILIVDEVLAVGDAEFQRRAVGKMKDVSQGEGRTVLFVSHNLAAVEVLCSRGLLVDKGRITGIGETGSIIKKYLTNQVQAFRPKRESVEKNFFRRIVLINNDFIQTDAFAHSEKIGMEIEMEINEWHDDLELALSVKNASQIRLFTKNITLIDYMSRNGRLGLRVYLAENYLMAGDYTWMIYINKPRVIAFDMQENILPFKVIDTGSSFFKYGQKMGNVFPPETEIMKMKHDPL